MVPSTSTPDFRSALSPLTSRLHGPGGLCNVGNAFGLITGLLLHLFAGDAPAQGAIQSFFWGSPGALVLTVSMLIFFVSGEAYYRALQGEDGPNPQLNQWGDVLSAWGALALDAGLMALGQPGLALTAGLLHALGKCGSARGWSGRASIWPDHWPDFWRALVLASRIPAQVAVLIELANLAHSSAAAAMTGPLCLLICYPLWMRADLLLFHSKD